MATEKSADLARDTTVADDDPLRGSQGSINHIVK